MTKRDGKPTETNMVDNGKACHDVKVNQGGEKSTKKRLEWEKPYVMMFGKATEGKDDACGGGSTPGKKAFGDIGGDCLASGTLAAGFCSPTGSAAGICNIGSSGTT